MRSSTYWQIWFPNTLKLFLYNFYNTNSHQQKEPPFCISFCFFQRNYNLYRILVCTFYPYKGYAGSNNKWQISFENYTRLSLITLKLFNFTAHISYVYNEKFTSFKLTYFNIREREGGNSKLWLKKQSFILIFTSTSCTFFIILQKL